MLWASSLPGDTLPLKLEALELKNESATKRPPLNTLSKVVSIITNTPCNVIPTHSFILGAGRRYGAENAAARRKWVTLTQEVRNGGGRVHVFSSAHSSGQQLGEITGVAAILRFPLPDLADAELPPVEF